LENFIDCVQGLDAIERLISRRGQQCSDPGEEFSEAFSLSTNMFHRAQPPRVEVEVR
jgi:hypothetical protein